MTVQAFRSRRRADMVPLMSSDLVPTVVKLDQLGDIAAAVPYLLGFQPADSVVAVALRGPRERMAFSMRLDLLPAEHDAQVAELVSAAMQRAEADAVFAFVYTDPPVAGGELPRRELIEMLMRALPMPLREAMLVTDDRLWSYTCPDEACCPPQGRRRNPAAPGTTMLAAAHALHGDAVLPSRDALVATVAPIAGPAAASMDQAIERAATAMTGVGADTYRDSTRALLARLLARYAEPPARLDDDEAAQLVVALHDIAFRDELLMCCVRQRDEAWPLLQALVRRALPPLDAPACTVFAVAAYLGGDGVLTATALERALASDPGYSLAGLVSSALHGQLPPDELRRIFAPPRRERRSRRRR